MGVCPRSLTHFQGCLQLCVRFQVEMAAACVVDDTVLQTILSMMQSCEARLRALEACVAACSTSRLVPEHPPPSHPTPPPQAFTQTHALTQAETQALTQAQTPTARPHSLIRAAPFSMIPHPNPQSTRQQTTLTDAASVPGWGSLIVSAMTNSWYTTADYPTFTVSVTGPSGKVMQDHPVGWRLHVSTINGHDQVDDSVLDQEHCVFPVCNGVASISGLKFTKITSQNGGWFRLLFNLRPNRSRSSTALLSHESLSKVVVRCYRMKCESKLSEADLKPDSDLRMLKGLGKAYVARWNKLGFHTIADLAKVDRRCRKARHDLLTKLRRNRGSLTEPKLLSVLELAHRVVEAAKISDENRRAEAELTELGTQTMTTCEMELAKLGTQTMTTCEM